MGPLCRLWDIVEKATNSNEQSVNASLDDMQKFIGQTVLVVGQSSNTVTYHRRYNLLNNLKGSSNQAKETLRKKKDLLQKHDGNLLGKKFRNHTVEVTKTRKTTIEAFSAGKSKSGSSRRGPFPEASQRKHQQKGRVAGRQILLTRGSNYQNNKRRWQQQNYHSNRGGRYQHSNQRGRRYCKIEQKSPPQDCLGGFTSSGERPQARTSHSKTIILQKGFTKPSPGRETQTFSQKLGTYNKRPRYISLNRRLQNTLFESTYSRLCTENSRNEQSTEGTSASTDRDNAEEKSNISDRSYIGRVYKLAISCGEKGWRSASSDKFEESKFICALRALQNGNLENLFDFNGMENFTRSFASAWAWVLHHEYSQNCWKCL